MLSEYFKVYLLDYCNSIFYTRIIKMKFKIMKNLNCYFVVKKAIFIFYLNL